MKQLICAADIEALKQAGKTVCVTGPDVIVTPSAKDAAEAPWNHIFRQGAGEGSMYLRRRRH